MARQALPPGPRQPAIVQSVAWWTRSAPFVERCRARYGKRFTMRLLGPPPFVVHSEPDHIREIFTAPPEILHPGQGGKILEPIVGSHSVLLLDEDRHMSQRKLMLPAFHGESIAMLEDLVREVTIDEIGRWPRDEAIELHPRLQALTLEIILRAVFGLEQGERLDGLRSGLNELLAIGSGPMGMVPGETADKINFGPFPRFREVRRETDELIYGLVNERRAESNEGRDDILSILLEARHEDGSPMSDVELRDELVTLLVAGHETTASELAWAFERLPRTPGALDTLTDEIRSDDGDEYTTAVIRETLRRRPVLPFAQPRFVAQETEVGGWRYDPGVCLVASAYLVHHDPEVYPEPYAFRPERFLESKPGTYTFIPFGGGRRRCLGASFAQLEMKIVLQELLRGADVRAGSEGPELTQRRNITVSPRGGSRVVIRDRAEAAMAVI